jgi:hypothetical protein
VGLPPSHAPRQLQRDGAKVERPTEIFKVRVVIPGGAKPRDKLTIHTVVGAFECVVPDRHGPTMEVDVPVPAAKAVKLGGRAPTVTKLLLNGVDTSTPSPMKRAASAASNKATRHIVFPLPAGAASGDLIDVQTELGTFQLVVPPSAHTALEADLPVPTDCELPALTRPPPRRSMPRAPRRPRSPLPAATRHRATRLRATVRLRVRSNPLLPLPCSKRAPSQRAPTSSDKLRQAPSQRAPRASPRRH